MPCRKAQPARAYPGRLQPHIWMTCGEISKNAFSVVFSFELSFFRLFPQNLGPIVLVRTSFFKGAQGRKRNSVTNIKAAHEPSTCATACNKAKGKRRRNRTARVSQNCRNVPSVFFFFFRGFVPFHRLFKWIAQKKTVRGGVLKTMFYISGHSMNCG